MSEPSRCLYIFDRTRPGALAELRGVFAEVLGADRCEALLDREGARLLVISVALGSWSFRSYASNAEVLHEVRTELDAIAALPAGTGPLSIDWRCTPELGTQLEALLSAARAAPHDRSADAHAAVSDSVPHPLPWLPPRSSMSAC